MTTKGATRTPSLLAGAIAAMMLVSIVGCASAHKGPFGSDGLPREKYLVGGGMTINWTAPQDGTAYVVMSAAGESKIIQTQYIPEAGEFDFSFSVDDQKTVDQMVDQIEKMLGAKLSEAKFSLYFVPSPKKKSAK